MKPRRLRAPLRTALALPLLCAALAGCPDTTEYPGSGGGGSGDGGGDAGSPPPGPVGKVRLVQTLLASDDPYATLFGNFVFSPSGEKIYVTSWAGYVLTFQRSPLDGSLGRVYDAPLFNASGLEITPDGRHLYAVGANAPDQLLHLAVDAVTGEPVPKTPSIHVRGSQVAAAANGTLLYHSSRELAGILSYRIDPISGDLTPGPKTEHLSPEGNPVLLVDDEHGALFANRIASVTERTLVRYAVDAQTGALTRVAEVPVDLWWGYSVHARCRGTTRIYVPQQGGSVGYADIAGGGLTLDASFAHPDLLHARGAGLSPDCKTLYVVTQRSFNGALVVLARDGAGDLSWLQTVPLGPGSSIPDITAPWYPMVSRDGKNVYVGSMVESQGFVVFARDTTGEAAP